MAKKRINTVLVTEPANKGRAFDTNNNKKKKEKEK